MQVTCWCRCQDPRTICGVISLCEIRERWRDLAGVISVESYAPRMLAGRWVHVGRGLVEMLPSNGRSSQPFSLSVSLACRLRSFIHSVTNDGDRGFLRFCCVCIEASVVFKVHRVCFHLVVHHPLMPVARARLVHVRGILLRQRPRCPTPAPGYRRLRCCCSCSCNPSHVDRSAQARPA